MDCMPNEHYSYHHQTTTTTTTVPHQHHGRQPPSPTSSSAAGGASRTSSTSPSPESEWSQELDTNRIPEEWEQYFYEFDEDEDEDDWSTDRGEDDEYDEDGDSDGDVSMDEDGTTTEEEDMDRRRRRRSSRGGVDADAMDVDEDEPGCDPRVRTTRGTAAAAAARATRTETGTESPETLAAKAAEHPTSLGSNLQDMASPKRYTKPRWRDVVRNNCVGDIVITGEVSFKFLFDFPNFQFSFPTNPPSISVRLRAKTSFTCNGGFFSACRSVFLFERVFSHLQTCPPFSAFH